jgi:hypothetical protein
MTRVHDSVLVAAGRVKHRECHVVNQFESKHAANTRVAFVAAARFLGSQHFLSFIIEIDPRPKIVKHDRAGSTLHLKCSPNK